MKNLIFISFLLITICCQAQTTKPVDGFLGVKFGSSAAQITEALTAKGAILNKEKSNERMLLFDNVTLASRKTTAFYVQLVNNQAFEAQFVFKPDLETKSIEYYNALVNDINDVYGKGKSNTNFKQPYTNGDGYEITAIKTGNAEYWTDWTIAENEISAQIKVNPDGSLRIRLYYTDGKLEAVNEAKKKEKNKSEF